MMRFITFVFLLALLSSCVSHKELVNFREVSLPLGRAERIANAYELRIQPNDLLRVQVESIDPNASAPFNQASAGQNMGQTNLENLQLFMGYLVDQDGYIDLPIIGRVEARGQTIESLQFLIRGKLKVFLKDPVVNVRFLNFKVTMLGEVNRPGPLFLTNSRMTLLEAIGAAGDMTDYADRSNIMLIREQDGTRSYQRIDLRTDEVFDSPYYYLQQNDVIYIEPLKARTATVADRGQRVVSYGTAFLSVIALIFTLTRN